MATFNTYKTTFNGESEIHQNKRDALATARHEADRTGAPVEVETLQHAGRRWDESAVVIRRAVTTVHSNKRLPRS